MPNADGEMEDFEMYEASNFEADLQAQFPEIRAYSGKGITDKYASLKLSISPQGIQTMVFRTDKENEFIEPYSQDHTVYAVFKSRREKGRLPWSCGTEDKKIIEEMNPRLPNTKKSSAGQLKTMRLAQSCTAEYSNYFGATSASQVGLVLAAFNNTFTRCNGVYEKDLALHLNLVASSTNVIYYNPSTDPYSDPSVGAADANSENNKGWGIQLQNTLSSSLTGIATTLSANNAAYDIGHLFGASGGGGNAGCIGCVCVNDLAGDDKNKGSGYTSPNNAIPSGDSFDVDYVTHEVGHQLGGNLTYTTKDEGTGVNVEVGSGITIMGYAGITKADVIDHSIDAFHAVTIAQIQTNLAGKTCPITTSITTNNATPTVTASANITIPISTPFALNTKGADLNAGDALTYSWEQTDEPTKPAQFADGLASSATETKPNGPNFISWAPTANNTRYFPKMTSIMANSKVTNQVNGDAGMQSEALLSIARTLNFRVTVRDNVPYSAVAPIKVGQTNFVNMTVTTNSTGGAFSVTSQATTGITYIGGTSQTITWVKGSTNVTPFNAANVDILITYDSGLTWTPILAGTLNDGTQIVTIPNPGSDKTNCRIMVRSAVTTAPQSYFFNVNKNAFTITTALGTDNFEFQDFGLFPNPNNGDFNLRFTSASAKVIRVNVHDMRGRQVYENSFSNTGTFNQNITLNKVAPGIYLVTLADGDKKTTKRIVVE